MLKNPLACLAGEVEAVVTEVVVTDAEGDVEETLVVETSSEEEA